ncbi:MAG: transposase, partial [Actinomycetota bacterium]|nr:transposase [Actinomycetota bacterium]
RLLESRSFPTTPLGLRRLADWLTRFGTVARVGVEGTGTYGLGLQRVLQARGIDVIEVNRPNRQLRRARGKSDTVDAEAAARAVLAGHATVIPKARDGIVESIRVLKVARDSTRRNRQRISGQLRHLVLTAPEPVRLEVTGLTEKALVARAARYRLGDDPADLITATKTALRTLARQHQLLTADLAALRNQLDTLTARANPSLRQLCGVGPDCAAALLITAGDNPDRIRSEAAFAALCGASPIEASSGKVRHHRLNRGGDRHANAALHTIVLVRMSCHQPTRDYIARRTTEGKSKRAIMRALKRYLAREIYHELVHPQPAQNTDDLRTRRQALHQSMHTVAEELDTTIMTVSRLERGLAHNRDLTTRYHQWLDHTETA